jgi:hypothetical protein
VVVERLLARTTAFDLDPACPARRRPNIFVRRFAQLGVVTVAA